MKTKIGVIFGGISREREVSFAGGRTVYDNLDKSLFEPIPIFIDSFGNLVLLNWEFVYKGSIRDFYPASSDLPKSPHAFQVYAESLGDLDSREQMTLIEKIGSRLDPSRLKELIDIAFLCLHGCDGEDGRIQGLLEFYRIPYTGSGINASTIGIDKVLQKDLMSKMGFEVPANHSIERERWLDRTAHSEIFQELKKKVEFPLVVKSSKQGSSIGVSVLRDDNEEKFIEAVDQSFFIKHLKKEDWIDLSHSQKVLFVKDLCDIREGIGVPIKLGSRMIYHPEELLSILMQVFAESEEEILIEAVHGESAVLFESFISGKEFSCIVVEDDKGVAIALPPTEIRKGAEVFDYRSKYLPGLSRKITPIDVDQKKLDSIRQACENLYKQLNFDVYARIDGFIKDDGTVFLNDPNTTSGMLPSSFFFHQAAEVGLNPTQFLTYIIVTSIRARIADMNEYGSLTKLLLKVERQIEENSGSETSKKKIAVLMGGYSSERHISVESGRNIFEKLASSEKYLPIPIFLTDNENTHELYTIPVNVLLKDNADDIKEKIDHYKVHDVINEIISKASDITSKYGSKESLKAPQKISYNDLKGMVDFVFIAMHGRPGEDGAVQSELENVGLPYNGSNPGTSEITIDKFRTNEILMENGFQAASHILVHKDDWLKDQNVSIERIESHFKYPFICKPVD
ncbi:MAG: D-alanine--D-alanine ligase, partial [Bacteroidia bacterium]|nr:D-alanine--D-alanine ligase [Bacteroidia bacterium]